MPTRHPRLLFTDDDLPLLRQHLHHGVAADFYADLLAACKACLTPGGDAYIDWQERASWIWRERHGIFVVVPALENLALGYALSNDRTFGEYAKNLAMAIIDHKLADVQALVYGNTANGWRRGLGHDKGKLARAMCWVYDMCHTFFSRAERQRFAEFACESIAIADAVRRDDVDQIANNRGIRGQMVQPWYHLTLEGEADLGTDPDVIYQAMIYYLDVHLCHGYAQDGAPYEGPNYVVLSSVASIAEALRRRGCPDLLSHNRFERLATYYLYELLPGGGGANNLNDADFPCGSVTHFLHIMDAPAGAIVPWLARRMDLHPKLADTRTQADAWRVYAFARWWDDSAPVRTPTALGYPPSHCFRQRGLADLRTGWDEDDWLVSHFCGRQQRRCHRQADFNHLSLYALGEHFLADSGYGKIGGRERDLKQAVDRWYQNADVHNCILIDGHGGRNANRYGGWCEGEILDFAETDQWVTSLGDASSVFSTPHRVRRSLRRVVLVKAVPIPFLIVLDVNEKDGKPFTASHVWQTSTGNCLEPLEDGFTIHGQVNRCEVRLFSPQALVIEPADQPLPQLRVHARAAVCEAVTVFFPLRPGQSLPALTVEHRTSGTVSVASQGVRLRLSTGLDKPLHTPHTVTLQRTDA